MKAINLPIPLFLTACLALAAPASPAAADTPAPGPGAPIRDGHAVELLVASLGDPNPLVRHLAARQLTAPELPAGAVAAALGEAIRSADERTPPEHIRAYAEILHAIGPPAAAAADAILLQLQPESPLLRNRAAGDLIQGYLFAALARVGAPPGALPVLLRALRSAAPGVYAGAASAAGTLGPAARDAVPFLRRALEPGFRDTTTDHLFAPAPPDAGLRPGHGSATTARREAMRALGKIGNAAAPAIPLLRRIAQNGTRDAASREQALLAIQALEGMGPVARDAFLQEWARLSKGARARVNQPAPDFSFRDLTGQTRPLKAWRGRLALFVFADTRCPCVAAYHERIRALHEKYKGQGLDVIYVFANPDDSGHDVEHFLAKNPCPWVTMRDEGQKLTRLLGARVASETFLLDRGGVLRYRGRVDDSIYDPKAVKERSLEDAIRALLGGRPVAKPETPAFGCAFPQGEEG